MFKSRKYNRNSRVEFERELNILTENILAKKIHISEHLFSSRMVHEITQVKYAPNKRIDLNTINEMIRTMAMSCYFPYSEG